jgi:ankyrin repeat protein
VDRTSDYNSISALSYAAYLGNRNAVILLLKAGANVNGKPESGEGKPLHFATVSSELAIVEELLKSGATVHALGGDYETALHLVQDVDIAKILLAAGADVNNDRPGYKPDLSFMGSAKPVGACQSK